MDNTLRTLVSSKRFVSGVLYAVIALLVISTVTYKGLVGKSEEEKTVALEQAGRVATLYFANQSESVAENKPVALLLMLDTGGAVVRTAEVHIVYSPDSLRDMSISFDKSTCAAFSNQHNDTKGGTLSFTCDRFNGTGSTQLQQLATLTATTTGTESPILSFVSPTKLISALGSDVLKYMRPITITLATQPASPGITIANHSTTTGQCVDGATVSLSWLKDADASSFLYSWNEATPSQPSVATISTNIDLPLKTGATYFFSIRSVSDSGSFGPVRSERVVSCP